MNKRKKWTWLDTAIYMQNMENSTTLILTFGKDQERVIDSVIEEIREKHINKVDKHIRDENIVYVIDFKTLFSAYFFGFSQGGRTMYQTFKDISLNP